jgi:hypothetical protein
VSRWNQWTSKPPEALLAPGYHATREDQVVEKPQSGSLKLPSIWLRKQGMRLQSARSPWKGLDLFLVQHLSQVTFGPILYGTRREIGTTREWPKELLVGRGMSLETTIDSKYRRETQVVVLVEVTLDQSCLYETYR